MKKISVIKYNGVKEPYNQRKVLDSIIRSGINRKEAQEILPRIEQKLHDNISTRELYQIVNKEILRQGLPLHSSLYRLREALAKMDPLNFEKFIKEVLKKEGYDCQWNLIIPGFCIDHQVDVVAKNEKGETFFIEVKRHRNFHRDSGLGTVVELWGRLEDLQKGYQSGKHKYDFTTAWLITNTKFSSHAKKYSTCKKLKLTGWRYSVEDDGISHLKDGLEKKIEKLGLEKVGKIINSIIGL